MEAFLAPILSSGTLTIKQLIPILNRLIPLAKRKINSLALALASQG